MVAEAYLIHYSNFNRRFDEVKYIRDIREPMVLIQDPIVNTSLAPSQTDGPSVIKNNNFSNKKIGGKGN